MRMAERRARAGIIVAGALVALACAATASAQSDAALDKGHISVRAVKVSSSDERKREAPRVIVTAVVDSAPEKVWAVVSDCSKYTSRMNRVETARQLQVGPVKQIAGGTRQDVVCYVEIGLPIPLSNLHACTKATHTIVTGKKWQRAWDLYPCDKVGLKQESSYYFNTGSWTVEPFGTTGKRSKVTYTVHAEPTTSVPDWVRERAQKSSLPKMIERLRQEAAKI